ncbi:unnamed protein product, partial [Mesorhabditis spiculigera]
MTAKWGSTSMWRNIVAFCPTTWVIPHAYEGEQDMEKSEKSEQDARVPQRVTNMKEKMSLIVPLLKLMIPLSVVYFAEYLINQGLTQLIYFNCKEGFRLSKSSQYRWYQVLYQVGVFFSRSSVNIIELPLIVLFILPILQLGNAVFFFFEARYAFLPHISIVFALILVEGFYGGASYVNTFNWIHKNIPPDVKEYSLSIASMSDAFWDRSICIYGNRDKDDISSKKLYFEEHPGELAKFLPAELDGNFQALRLLTFYSRPNYRTVYEGLLAIMKRKPVAAVKLGQKCVKGGCTGVREFQPNLSPNIVLPRPLTGLQDGQRLSIGVKEDGAMPPGDTE